jgi:hypothetical protein
MYGRSVLVHDGNKEREKNEGKEESEGFGGKERGEDVCRREGKDWWDGKREWGRMRMDLFPFT